jgi:hypothetical protein
MAKVDVVLVKTDIKASQQNALKLQQYLGEGYIIDKMTTIGQWHNEIMYVLIRNNKTEED